MRDEMFRVGLQRSIDKCERILEFIGVDLSGRCGEQTHGPQTRDQNPTRSGILDAHAFPLFHEANRLARGHAGRPTGSI
jgi:hypothetical protein